MLRRPVEPAGVERTLSNPHSARSIYDGVTVALANKTARIIWALLIKKPTRQLPVVAKA